MDLFDFMMNEKDIYDAMGRLLRNMKHATGLQPHHVDEQDLNVIFDMGLERMVASALFSNKPLKTTWWHTASTLVKKGLKRYTRFGNKAPLHVLTPIELVKNIITYHDRWDSGRPDTGRFSHCKPNSNINKMMQDALRKS